MKIMPTCNLWWITLLLLVTIFIAPDTKGSRSWLVIGPMSLQPAEFGKFATALCLANCFQAIISCSTHRVRTTCSHLLIIFLPVVLILGQKETGSALVYLSLFLCAPRGHERIDSACCSLRSDIFVVAVKFTGTLILESLRAGCCVHNDNVAYHWLCLRYTARNLEQPEPCYCGFSVQARLLNSP